jgi:hypothetical protein
MSWFDEPTSKIVSEPLQMVTSNSRTYSAPASDDAWANVFDTLDATQMMEENQSQKKEDLFDDSELDFLTQEDENQNHNEQEEAIMFSPILAFHPDTTSSSCQAVSGSGTKRPKLVVSTMELPCLKKQKRSHSQSKVVSHPQLRSCSDNLLHINSQQMDKWETRFQELVVYKLQNGHCCVPTHWSENMSLAQWVKRQRFQYRLKHEGKHTTLTLERQVALEQHGFIWDLHDAIWEERLNNDLMEFKLLHGHCKVPVNYPANPELAIWAKSQRRHFIHYCNALSKGQEWKSNTMNLERILKLSQSGFVFSNRTGQGALDAIQGKLLQQTGDGTSAYTTE